MNYTFIRKTYLMNFMQLFLHKIYGFHIESLHEIPQGIQRNIQFLSQIIIIIYGDKNKNSLKPNNSRSLIKNR